MTVLNCAVGAPQYFVLEHIFSMEKVWLVLFFNVVRYIVKCSKYLRACGHVIGNGEGKRGEETRSSVRLVLDFIVN